MMLFTCEYVILASDDIFFAIDSHAEMDHGEHGQVHQNALD